MCKHFHTLMVVSYVVATAVLEQANRVMSNDTTTETDEAANWLPDELPPPEPPSSRSSLQS